MKETKFDKGIVELVIKRLETIPPNVKMSIGSKGTFEIKDIIESVKKQDEVGKSFINMQLKYLKALKHLSEAR